MLVVNLGFKTTEKTYMWSMSMSKLPDLTKQIDGLS